MSKKNKSFHYRKSNFRLAIKFLLIVIPVVLLYTAIGMGLALAYKNKTTNEITLKDIPVVKNETPLVEVEDNIRSEKNVRKLNVAVFGVDEDGFRTDVIFALSFDTETKKISIVAVPRDTRVVMPKAMMEDMVSRGRGNYIPHQEGVKGQCKLNEIHAFAGSGYRNAYSVWMMEEILDIDFDYYVKINIEGFKSLVDAIGGVPFTVEKDLYYYDPTADFKIDLKAGYQVLDGTKAEMLVRERKSYGLADLTRIKVQQAFLKELLKTVLNKENLMSNIPSLVKTFFKYVDTDLPIAEALKYSKYINDISSENLYTNTVPGTPGDVYFEIDKEGTRLLVEEVFYDVEVALDNEENTDTNTANTDKTGTSKTGTDKTNNNEALTTIPKEATPREDSPKNTTATSYNSRSLKIFISNGGKVNGLAGIWEAKLKKDGYTIEGVETYKGDQTRYTRLIVREDGMGEDIRELFKGTVIITDSKNTLPDGVDIQIILGKDER